MTSSKLKWIAAASMLLDHFGVGVLYFLLTENSAVMADAQLYSNLYTTYRVLRTVGRLAFPLFAYLLVIGFFYTSDHRKHLLRLAVFAVLSELPFDLAFFCTGEMLRRGEFWYWGYQNVLITLTLAYLAMLGIRACREKIPNRMPALLCCTAVAAAACAAAWLMKADYGGEGILAILVIYVFHETDLPYRKEIAMFAAVSVLAVFSVRELWAMADVVLISFYHGARGRRWNRWFFYIFYPAHALVLFGLRLLLV